MIDIIEKIVAEMLSDNKTPHEIALAINNARMIYWEIQTLTRKVEDEQKACDKAIKILQDRQAEIRKSCCHWAKRYCGDPAGGRDSYYECLVCKANI